MLPIRASPALFAHVSQQYTMVLHLCHLHRPKPSDAIASARPGHRDPSWWCHPRRLKKKNCEHRVIPLLSKKVSLSLSFFVFGDLFFQGIPIFMCFRSQSFREIAVWTIHPCETTIPRDFLNEKPPVILLMEEILHHLGCIKPYK